MRRIGALITSGGGPLPDSRNIGKNASSPIAWALRADFTINPTATPRVSIVTVPAANPTATSNGRWSSGMPYVGIAAASTVRAATTTRPAPTIACAPATDRVGTPKAANRRRTSRSRYDARMTGMPMSAIAAIGTPR